MQLTSLSLALSRIAGGGFSPLSLFAAGEQGAWYDPSDLSTLYQDSAGTTPVTAVEQRVGLMLDKSKGLALGSELVTNGDFSNGTTGWTGTSATLTNDTNRLKVSPISSAGFAYQAISTVVGQWYQLTFSVTNIDATGRYLFVGTAADASAQNFDSGALSDGTYTRFFFATETTTYIKPYVIGSGKSALYDNISVKQIAGNHAFQATTTPNDKRPILSARVNLLLATSTLSTQTVTTQATSYKLTFTGTGTIALSGTYTMVASGAGTYTFTATAGSLIVTVVGSVTNADLRPANIGNNIPTYQRVNTATNYDTTGFPYYLKADGTYTSMSTNSIDFSATDKMTVVSGVRKLSDAATAMFLELSASGDVNNGTFQFDSPDGANSKNIAFYSKGSANAGAVSPATQIPPISMVATGLGNISAPSSILNINGVQVATKTTSQGLGNYGNYPLYLLARNNTQYFFNGYFYGAIVRGATTSGTDLTNAESYMNTQSGGLY